MLLPLRGGGWVGVETHYRRALVELGRESGLLGVIFRKSQNRIQNPANKSPNASGPSPTTS